MITENLLKALAGSLVEGSLIDLRDGKKDNSLMHDILNVLVKILGAEKLIDVIKYTTVYYAEKKDAEDAKIKALEISVLDELLIEGKDPEKLSNILGKLSTLNQVKRILMENKVPLVSLKDLMEKALTEMEEEKKTEKKANA